MRHLSMFCLCYNCSYTTTINSVNREELLLPLPVMLNECQMLKAKAERSRLWPRLRQKFWPWGWGQKFEADANVTRLSVRPKCQPRGQSDLEALTSVTTATSIVVQWWLPHASKVLFLALYVTVFVFLFVTQISREQMNGFAPSYRQYVFGHLLGRIWVSLSKVKGQGHQGQNRENCCVIPIDNTL